MGIDFDRIGGAVDDLTGAIGSFSAAKGYKAQAKGYDAAAEISRVNKEIASEAAGIQAFSADRDIYKTLGAQRAAIGANGLSASGSALDVLRDSATQGSLTKQLLGRQSAIESLSYDQEAASFEMQAAAARNAASSSKKSGIGGLVKTGLTIASLFSDETLKEDVKLLYRRPDGVGMYSFRYRGQTTVFKGVLAQEVERIYPAAVTTVDGHKAVDYAMIDVQPEVISA